MLRGSSYPAAPVVPVVPVVLCLSPDKASFALLMRFDMAAYSRWNFLMCYFSIGLRWRNHAVSWSGLNSYTSWLLCMVAFHAIEDAREGMHGDLAVASLVELCSLVTGSRG